MKENESYDVYLCEYQNVVIYNYPYLISEVHREQRRNPEDIV